MENIVSFALKKAGDSAIVRILHSNTSTMERDQIHWVEGFGGKKKCFKCLGDGCSICASAAIDSKQKAQEKLYIKLFDYTDNTVKVWNRTPNQKFLNQLDEIVNDWGPLNECVIKITRDSDEFPTYSTAIQPAKGYAVPSEPVDEKIAFRMCAKRSNEEIETFIKTGNLPPKEKKEWLSKEEYAKKKEAEKNGGSYTPTQTAQAPSYVAPASTIPAAPVESFVPAADDDDNDLPF